MELKKSDIKIEDGWKEALWPEFQKDYLKNLKSFLKEELNKKKVIYPPAPEIFSAFNCTPYNQVKVVIIGQDPYHGPNQAHGLCFSVKPGVPPPPSLQNIFKELHNDLGLKIPNHGHLTSWATQGVFLLNAILTVEKGKPLSHQNHGWEQFTDKVVEVLNGEKENLVFLLWGSPAQKKGARVNPKKHLVLKAPHPSPLSAHRGFLGCKHFSQANSYLKKNGAKEINWSLVP